MGVEVEQLDQYIEVVACPNSDTQSAMKKELVLQVQNFGIAVRPMIRYVGGRQRGKKLPGRRKRGVVGVLFLFKSCSYAEDTPAMGSVFTSY